MYSYQYIYIYIEREREREKENYTMIIEEFYYEKINLFEP